MPQVNTRNAKLTKPDYASNQGLAPIKAKNNMQPNALVLTGNNSKFVKPNDLSMDLIVPSRTNKQNYGQKYGRQNNNSPDGNPGASLSSFNNLRTPSN